jgi:hypothetical protein
MPNPLLCLSGAISKELGKPTLTKSIFRSLCILAAILAIAAPFTLRLA